MRVETNPVRGTFDFLPREAEIREEVRRQIVTAYQKNGFLLIETPVLESLDLLDKSDGGDNLRLMFKTIKRRDKLDLSKPNLSEKDIVAEGMRYDLTVPLARFFAGNREKLPFPFKSLQCGYAFRAERPQKGRNRQFVQCDIDIFGDPTVLAEIEILTTCMNVFATLGFEKVVMKTNSRKILNEVVLFSGFEKADIKSVCVTLDKLDKIETDGVEKELLDKGLKASAIKRLLNAVSQIKEKGLAVLQNFGVDKETVAEMKTLLEVVGKNLPKGFEVVFDISIVRGQGYYTGMIFEAYTDGFSGAIGGGGRFDSMVKGIVGLDVPAVGFSIGVEPVMLLLSEKQKVVTNKRIALFFDEKDEFSKVLARKEQLVKEFFVSVFPRPKNFKNTILKLKENGFVGYLVFGDDKVSEI